ncbi:MAG: membrane dipeptidase, partial [Sphingopyxis sp.]|nr:membrane dipeptidase [Sphingopyxis sp.]
MHKPSLLAGLAALALVTTPAAAQKSPEAIAEAALQRAPVFDGHNDVPWELRGQVGNVINNFDFRDTTRPKPDGTVMHTDIQRLRKGRVGAQFWSVYVPSNTNEQLAVQQTIE